MEENGFPAIDGLVAVVTIKITGYPEGEGYVALHSLLLKHQSLIGLPLSYPLAQTGFERWAARSLLALGLRPCGIDTSTHALDNQPPLERLSRQPHQNALSRQAIGPFPADP